MTKICEFLRLITKEKLRFSSLRNWILRRPIQKGPAVLIPNYLEEFPIPAAVMPASLRNLLEPAGDGPEQRIEVTKRYEHDQYGPQWEYIHMTMALVPPTSLREQGVLNEASDGVVYYSTPYVTNNGGLSEFQPSISGHEYIVASRGDGSFFSYSLAEKVWIALGLTPRCIGNEKQKIVYDDLSLPKFGIAEGEVSSNYYWERDRDVSWKISNEYLRRYLWMRDRYGVRVFFYQAQLPDSSELRALMTGQKHVVIRPENGWYEIDICEHNQGLLLKVWASVAAVSPEACQLPDVETLIWPGDSEKMTKARANSLIHGYSVYLDDKFLERYEQNSIFQSSPSQLGTQWRCNPSYLGQWSFTDCARVGRNMIKVPIRELYKPKPDIEILHAYQYALTPEQASDLDPHEEHIVAKTNRFLNQLLELEDLLTTLGTSLGVNIPETPFYCVSKRGLQAEGWSASSKLCCLAEVAPLSMSEQAFLSRSKSIHEFWQTLPNAFLRNLIQKAGHSKRSINSFGSLRLLQTLTNIVERLNTDGESLESFDAGTDETDLNSRNSNLSALFVTNELRIADAHTVGGTLQILEQIGFDPAGLNDGYGRALDHVFDSVNASFAHLNEQLKQLIQR